MEYPHALYIDTDFDADELRRRLKSWEPWSGRIEFSNGVSTAEFGRRVPFADNLIGKLKLIEREVALEQFAGQRALDVGCSSGHNSIAMAGYGARVTGIDYNSRHIAVARFLATVAGVDAEFEQADAEEFVREGEFALILHLGTLYHLPNPVRALSTAAANLTSGGTLVIETQVYDLPDDPNACAFLHDVNNDPTNWWALSPAVISRILERQGFEPPREVFRATPEIMPENQSRMILVARKGN
jgi:SAM-dependent methyltransferase